jgi:hypothetical protein
MAVLPLFFGFLFGAAIGTVATASSGPRLHKEATSWLFRSRWQIYTSRKTWRFPKFLWRALDLLQVEILVIFIGIWICGLLWTIFLTPSWDHKSHIQYIIGSLVGTAAAPWIWLHFSASFGAEEKAAAAETTASDNTQFSRYRFMTYMLGTALLAAVLQYYLPSLLPRTNKIEVAGVALNFTPPRNERGLKILQTGQQTSSALGATTSRLANATTFAHRVGTGHEEGKLGQKRITLSDVTADMAGFNDLSMIDRDKVYIAYLYHERATQLGGPTVEPNPSNLQIYVDKAKTFDQKPDADFLAGLANLSECLALYAENLRDFRLFLVDTEPFLRELLVNVAAQWNEKKEAGSKGRAGAFRPRPQGSAKLNFTKATQQLADDVVTALQDSHIRIPAKVCTNPATLVPGDIDVSEIGKTPYPAYMIAHYLAAIDSVESGVVVLRDWIFHQRNQINSGLVGKSPEQGWYAVRAMLASSQLPYRFGSLSPTHRASVQFQQETTDRFAALLGVHNARSWRSLCKRLDKSGLHARIGRYLAWTYADERNYLFELLGPEDFGLPPPGEAALISTHISPAVYLEEAEAIAEASECFADVPAFADDQRNLVGQYFLNVAQLRYSLRASKEGDEKAALTRKIRADLERARQLETEPGTGEVLDLLRQADPFEAQRARLAKFRTYLDNESEKD